MPDIRHVTDKNGNVFYPMTHELGVRDSNGVRLSTKLRQTNAVLDNMGSLMGTLDDKVNGLNATELIKAWDGSSTPVEGDIPAGISVEYDSTVYTGSLSASGNTMGKVYLVGNENDDDYDRYITSYDGVNYSWVFIGTTEVDMSDYKRKDDEIWLTESEFEALAVKDTTKIYNVYEETAEI